MQDDTEVMHKVRYCIKLVFAVNVVACRVFSDYFPELLFRNYCSDLVLSFVGTLVRIHHIIRYT